jgi:hypothetical protein
MMAVAGTADCASRNEGKEPANMNKRGRKGSLLRRKLVIKSLTSHIISFIDYIFATR